MKRTIKTLAVFFFLMNVGTLSLHAQAASAGAALARQPLQPSLRYVPGGARSFKHGVQVGGRFYISPSVQFGQEILLPTGKSVVGNQAQQTYLYALYATRGLGQRLSHQIAEYLSETTQPEHFPGFEIDFPHKWKKFTREYQVSVEGFALVLNAAYGRDALGEGSFVSSFEQVRRLSVLPVEKPAPFDQALNDALNQAQEVKNGFLVIRVLGNDRRPKDTLVLDLSSHVDQKPFHWISVNQSRDQAWKAVLNEDKAREFKGVQLRMDEVYKGYIWASADGENWQMYQVARENGYMFSLIGDDIIQASQRGYYIFLPEEKGGIVGFAKEPGGQVFPSLAELEKFLKANEP